MIFILEDNDDRISHFRSALGGRDYHIERTVPEAIAWLSGHQAKVTLYSLDNDLVVLDFDGDEGEGWQLCEWIIANASKAPIICHTTNSHAGTKMEMVCSDAGWDYQRVVPYNSFEWISRTWIHVIEENC